MKEQTTVEGTVKEAGTPEAITVSQSVLVLGAGMSGTAIAIALAKLGLSVVVVEKGNATFGKGFQEGMAVELLTGARLLALEGNFGAFRASVERMGQVVVREVGAVVVAVGLNRRPAKQLPSAMALTEFRRRVGDGQQSRNVCFLMDLEENTPLAEFRVGLECAFTVARTGSNVRFLCREVKVAEEGLERLYRSAREEGVLFVKYEERPLIAPLGEEVSVQATDYSPGAGSHLSRLRLAADVIVLPDVLLPNEENPRLGDLLGTDLDEEGYFQSANVRLDLSRTNRRGIFVAGDCGKPSTPTEVLQGAEATAQEVAALLAGGEVRVDWPVAVVDAEKCAFCLTCNRVCPHKAAGMDAEEEAAVIYPSDCYGCGVCVAECPSAAITIEKYADSDLIGALRG